VGYIIEKAGGVKIVDPSHVMSDESIASFMMFAIRDACEFIGIVKNSVPQADIARMLYKFKVLTAIKDALGEVVDE